MLDTVLYEQKINELLDKGRATRLLSYKDVMDTFQELDLDPEQPRTFTTGLQRIK